jgi:hypothetical protein
MPPIASAPFITRSVAGRQAARTPTLRHERKRFVSVVALLAVLGVAASLIQGHGQATGSVLSASQKSALLTTAAQVAPGSGAVFEGGDARKAAEELMSSLPLPSDATVDLQWETMGPITTGDIQLMLQMQAACKWYEQVLQGNQSDPGETIVAELPNWSAFRGTEVGGALQAIATASASQDLGPMKDFVRSNCGAPQLPPRSR